MKRFQPIGSRLAFGLFAFSACAFTQTPAVQPAQPPPATDNSGWKPIGAPSDAQNAPAPAPPPASLPAQLTLRPGTYVTVRMNQFLSSDKNHAGDAFAATLAHPLIVDGWVVAERGQTLGGKVIEARKAGRVSGTSRLAVQLTDIPLASGQQLPVQTTLISRQGPTSHGRDAAAIAGTTAFGAAVGAAAAWGTGAAWGAGAGFAAATLGVLLTRGQPTIIPPESMMTFRLEQPVTISTTTAPQTFRPVEPADYQQAPPPRMMTRGPGYPPPPPAYYYGPAYYPYPYYWGPGYYGGVFFGPRFYYRHRW